MKKSIKELTAILIVIEAPFERRMFRLSKPYYAIGRNPNNEIVLPDSQVSRHHATLIKKKHKQSGQEFYFIYDGNLKGKKSSNGLIINEFACENCMLKNNDSIRLGNNIRLIYHNFIDETDSDVTEALGKEEDSYKRISQTLANKKTIVI